MKEFDKIILGIDPGTNVLGYGLIGITAKKITLISTGVVRMSKLENHQLKLKKIFESITYLIEEYFPDEVAVEAPFFGKNVQSMLKLGEFKVWQWLLLWLKIYLLKNIPLVK